MPVVDYSGAVSWNNHPLKVIINQEPKKKTPLDQLVFGQFFTDHMLVCEWTKEAGWLQPTIKPFENLSLHPASSVLQYGLECFEGMKAYKDGNGRIRLFRPEENMQRFHDSAVRLAMPGFDKFQLLEMIKQWLKVEQTWIPDKPGYSLYIRPTMIATQETLGVGPANKATLFVIGCPVGQYYAGLSSVSIYAEGKHVRAWPGGTGCYKMGGNYAPTILPQLEVAQKGYAQILWLLGPDHQITEVGTMNLFVFYKGIDGRPVLFTPALDGTILPGVTRKSILEATRAWNEFDVVEGKMSMEELIEIHQEGRLLEVFGSGTAAIVSPVNKIFYAGEDYLIPLDPEDPSKQSGPLAQRLWKTLIDIQYGMNPHPWSMIVD